MYRALLGSAWPELPEVVRAVHEPGRIAGQMDVHWGTGLWARALARLLGFPVPVKAAAVVLEIEQGSDRALWTRRIGAARLVTEQSVVGGLVLEALGLVVCAFQVQADAHGLWYVQKYAGLRWGRRVLRLPAWLGPRVVARVTREGDKAHTHVQIMAPLLGVILRYDGRVTRSVAEPAEAT